MFPILLNGFKVQRSGETLQAHHGLLGDLFTYLDPAPVKKYGFSSRKVERCGHGENLEGA